MCVLHIPIHPYCLLRLSSPPSAGFSLTAAVTRLRLGHVLFNVSSSPWLRYAYDVVLEPTEPTERGLVVVDLSLISVVHV